MIPFKALANQTWRFRKAILSLGLLFIILLGLFTYLTIFKYPATSNSNIIAAYYSSAFELLSNWWLLEIIILIVWSIYLNKQLPRLRIYSKWLRTIFRFPLLAGLLTLLTIFLSFNLALLLTYLITITQLNYIAYRVKVNPKSVGIISGKQAVNQAIGQSSDPINVVETNYKDLSTEIISRRIDTKGHGKLYIKQILPSIPSKFTPSLKLPKESLIMIGNTLFVVSLNSEDLQYISPDLGYKLISTYFSPRLIKKNPTLGVLGRQDYLKLRENQINNQLNGIDSVIAKVDDYVNSEYGLVSNDKAKIAINQNGLNSSITYKSDDYTNCLSYGYYDFFTGAFRRYYNDSYCQLKASNDWDYIISGYQKNISDWTDSLNNDQYQLNLALDVKSRVKDYRAIVAGQKDNTPQELGIFHDENKIDIALDWVNAKSIFSYLETLTHEYLHYSSYVSQEKQLPLFFEEGLTEYYARGIMKKELSKDINLGYPLLVKFMAQIAKKLPNEELENIYFTKDQGSLVQLLDKTYGNKFYEDNELNFQILPYLSGQESLKIVNKMMDKIGGDKFNESDLNSDYFSLKN